MARMRGAPTPSELIGQLMLLEKLESPHLSKGEHDKLIAAADKFHSVNHANTATVTSSTSAAANAGQLLCTTHCTPLRWSVGEGSSDRGSCCTRHCLSPVFVHPRACVNLVLCGIVVGMSRDEFDGSLLKAAEWLRNHPTATHEQFGEEFPLFGHRGCQPPTQHSLTAAAVAGQLM